MYSECRWQFATFQLTRDGQSYLYGREGRRVPLHRIEGRTGWWLKVHHGECKSQVCSRIYGLIHVQLGTGTKRRGPLDSVETCTIHPVVVKDQISMKPFTPYDRSNDLNDAELDVYEAMDDLCLKCAPKQIIGTLRLKQGNAKKPPTRLRGQPATQHCRVYVAGLHSDLKPADIVEMYDDFGTIKEVEYPVSVDAKIRHGTAVVTYQRAMEATRAERQMKGFCILGKRILTSTSKSRAQRQYTTSEQHGCEAKSSRVKQKQRSSRSSSTMAEMRTANMKVTLSLINCVFVKDGKEKPFEVESMEKIRKRENESQEPSPRTAEYARTEIYATLKKRISADDMTPERFEAVAELLYKCDIKRSALLKTMPAKDVLPFINAKTENATELVSVGEMMVITEAANPSTDAAYKDVKLAPQLDLKDVYDDGAHKEDPISASVKVFQSVVARMWQEAGVSPFALADAVNDKQPLRAKYDKLLGQIVTKNFTAEAVTNALAGARTTGSWTNRGIDIFRQVALFVCAYPLRTVIHKLRKGFMRDTYTSDDPSIVIAQTDEMDTLHDAFAPYRSHSCFYTGVEALADNNPSLFKVVNEIMKEGTRRSHQEHKARLRRKCGAESEISRFTRPTLAWPKGMWTGTGKREVQGSANLENAQWSLRGMSHATRSKTCWDWKA